VLWYKHHTESILADLFMCAAITCCGKAGTVLLLRGWSVPCR
jgi:hypothetical protein